MSKYETLAKEIYLWCKANDLWGDNTIYFDGRAWSDLKTWSGETGRKIDEDLYEYENKNPKTYFEYANPDTLSMSFEGALYYVLNANVRGWIKKEAAFQELFEKHGVYYELGHAWNLSVYPNE